MADEQMSLAAAIASGDLLQIMLATRRDIAADLPETQGPAKAALYRQLTLLSKEIEALLAKDAEDSEGGADVEDEEFDPETL